jgi:hypothetical protein
MEEGFSLPLKSILENTGVALEARLHAIAQELTEQAGMPLDDLARSSAGSETTMPHVLETDLKARLLQMRERIQDLAKQALQDHVISQDATGNKAETTKAALARMLDNVNGLLRNIQTFQLLSKLTHSFYTFLPVIWKGLREGEIAFKRSRSGPEGRSYYCLMNLDFEHLGKLTVVAMMQGRDIFVSFKTDHADFRSVLDKNIHELKQMILAQGFTLKAVNFLGKHEDYLAPFERLESFESIINIRI